MILQLPVNGQGVFSFHGSAFRMLNADHTNGLKVEFTADHVAVTDIGRLYPCIDPENKQGLSNYKGAYYWFSLDAQNQRIYAGIGEARLETAIYKYTFPAASKSFLESITCIEFEWMSNYRVLKDPITKKIPLAVKDTNELTMDDIAAGTFMPKANLSPIAQKLYDCIAGSKFTLNTPDFPDFAQAIEYSIRTPGLWCYNKIREKSTEFNPDNPNIAETYLRITLGENNGESPGIPYVMEIWPVGHYSPIHSHANANAIIRVLSGEIHVLLYPFLSKGSDIVPPFGSAIFKEGDVAWISPTLNQVHKLKNLETNTYTCITIQCYMYQEKDGRHYDYFDYLDDDGEKHQYEPDSDMEFLEFKARMRAEWNARPQPAVVPIVEPRRLCWLC